MWLERACGCTRCGENPYPTTKFSTYLQGGLQGGQPEILDQRLIAWCTPQGSQNPVENGDGAAGAERRPMPAKHGVDSGLLHWIGCAQEWGRVTWNDRAG